MEEAENYRCRRIYLKPSDDPAAQAQAACNALANIDGIELAAPHTESSIHIIYSLDKISFEILIEVLDELDFQMDTSILVSLRNTIFHFLDENAREQIPEQAERVEDNDTDEGETPEIPQADDEQYWKDYH